MAAKQMNSFLEEQTGFAKFAFAEKRAQEVLGNLDVRWFIYPLQNGRFVPVMLYNERHSFNIGYIASKGIVIMN